MVPSRTLPVRTPRSGQVHRRSSEPGRMQKSGQGLAVELVPQSAAEEHTVWLIVSAVQREGQPAEEEWATPGQWVMAAHHTKSTPMTQPTLV